MIYFSFITLIVPLLLFVAVIYLIVRPRHDIQRNARNPYRALTGYFFLIIAASIITMMIGIFLFVKVGISQAYDGDAIRNDLTLATVLLCTGLVICILHVYGKRFIPKKEAENTADIKRIYLFSMLGIFSLSGLISIPLVIYKTVYYYIAEEPSRLYYPYSSYSPPSPPAPTTEMAIAIVILPLWIYFLFRVLREIKGKYNTMGMES